MAEPAFPPGVRHALDSYTVPPLPPGFSDRLMARISTGETGSAMPLPPVRRRPSSPWRRGGRIVGSVVLLSLATATAAAAGVFGGRVYVPMISEALVQTKVIAEAPMRKPHAQLAKHRPAPLPVAAAGEAAAGDAAPGGSAAIVGTVAALRADPAFNALPPRERIAVARREVSALVRSGEATRQDVRTAARELVREADPATKAAWRKAAAERRQQRLARRAEAQIAPNSPATTETATDTLAVAPPADVVSPSLEPPQTLRERLRSAPPEQRAALLDAWRARRRQTGR